MRSINIIRKYNISPEDEFILEANGHINGCGGKEGFNFDKLILRIKKLFNFQSEKLDFLISDLKVLCRLNHDIDFARGGNFIDFYIANRDFSFGIINLLHWTNSFGRFIVFVTIFIPLMIFGTKYFKWGEKRSLNYLLKDDGNIKTV